MLPGMPGAYFCMPTSTLFRHFTKLCRLVYPWESASNPIYQVNQHSVVLSPGATVDICKVLMYASVYLHVL